MIYGAYNIITLILNNVRIIRDNLEFLQWMKRFWDSNYGGQGYDAVGRRRGAPAEPPATIAPLSTGARSASAVLGVGGRSGGKTPISGHRAGSTQPNEAMQALQAQLREMSTHMEGLEKERDFYFAKVCRYPSLSDAQFNVCIASGYRDPRSATNRDTGESRQGR